MESQVMILLLLALGIIGYLLSYLGVVALRHWAEKRHIIDIPNERSSHTRPIPRGGGLLIVLITLLGFLGAAPLVQINLFESGFITIGTGAALIAIVSWYDDLGTTPCWIRFAAHAVGAILVISFIGYGQSLTVPFLPSINVGWPGILLAFLWLTGFTNAYNFMDGIDGIAGSQAVIAGVAWWGFGVLLGEPLLNLPGLFIAASSLGFLGHNWPPARIFMGDVGSAFLGFCLATLTLTSVHIDPRLPVAGVLIVWPFVFDTTFTILRRLQLGENIFAAHRSHLYQRLVIAGYSHQSVTLLYTGLSLIGVLVAYLWMLQVPSSDWLVIILPTINAIVLWYYVRHVETRTNKTHRIAHSIMHQRDA